MSINGQEVLEVTKQTGSRSFSYSVFHFISDEMKGTSVPIGVVLWGSEAGPVITRFAQPADRVRGLNKMAYFQINGVQEELKKWMRTGDVPYARADFEPNTDAWWRHVSALLVHQVRASQPRPIDCVDPDEEIEPLYEAVVGPRRGLKERTQRIDQALSRCLGSLGRKLDRGTVNGFKGREVEVRRFKTGSDKLLIVDGVNLASAHAEQEADALVSKLLRIREGSKFSQNGRSLKLCVGYLASPHGLNGEAILVDWIQEKAEAETFDLIREREKFVSTVDDELAALQPQARLHSRY
jgi:Protein of unknown function (DUF3037)